MKKLFSAREAATATRSAGRSALRLLGRGLVEIGHHSLAAVGLAVVAVALFVASQPQLRTKMEGAALDWLEGRQDARAEASGNLLLAVGEPEAATRATAVDPSALSQPQAALAQWISRRYKVAPEPIARLVQEAWSVGQRAGIEPTLILAIMAVESSFNPFAQSPMGAQGLMQVMTRIHNEKFSAFGGEHAAFDPVANLRVGVQVLKECIARMGSVEAGLRAYVGDLNLPQDSGYSARVLAEQTQMRHVSAQPAASRPDEKSAASAMQPPPAERLLLARATLR